MFFPPFWADWSVWKVWRWSCWKKPFQVPCIIYCAELDIPIVYVHVHGRPGLAVCTCTRTHTPTCKWTVTWYEHGLRLESARSLSGVIDSTHVANMWFSWTCLVHIIVICYTMQISSMYTHRQFCSWPPFIIRLPYDHLHSSCACVADNFAYKKNFGC